MRRTTALAVLCCLPTVMLAAAPGSASVEPPRAAGSQRAAVASVPIVGADQPIKGKGLKVRKGAPGWRWAGARQVNEKMVYRLDPFKPGEARRWRTALPSSKVSAVEARAAWLLSGRSMPSTPVAGAALEFALHAVVSPRTHGLDSRLTKRRLKGLGRQGGAVLTQARQLVSDAAKYAGPYAVSVLAPEPAALGTDVAVQVQVTSAAGLGLSGLPVSFVQPDRTAVSSTTDALGTATMRVPAASGEGWAQVGWVPDTRVSVLRAAVSAKKSTRISRLAVVGTTTTSSASVTLRALPAASPTNAPTQKPTTTVTATSTASSTATSTASSTASGTATGTAKSTGTSTATATASNPSTRPSTNPVPTTGTSTATATAKPTSPPPTSPPPTSPTTAPKATPKVSVPPIADMLALNTQNLEVTYSGSTGTTAKAMRLTLFGPFETAAQARCEGTELLATDRTVTGNGSVSWAPRFDKAGFFALRVNVAGDSANEGSSLCSNVFRVNALATSLTWGGTYHESEPKYTFWTYNGPQVPAGLEWPRVVVTYYGPFYTRGASNCTSTQLSQVIVVPTTAPHRLDPSFIPPDNAFYRAKAEIMPTSYSSGFSVCSPEM